LAAAQRTVDGRIHIEIGYNQPATNTEALEYTLKAVAQFDPVALAIEGRSPAAVLEPLLIECQVQPTMTSTADLATACGGFLDDALQARLSHTGQQVLRDAAASCIKRELPGGGFAWQKQAGGSIAQLMAATLSRFSLLTFGAPPKQSPPPLWDTPQRGRHEDDLDRALGPGKNIMTTPF